MNSLIGRSLIVSGRVQGVFYRASTLEEAGKLALRGWVKNLSGGQVQIEVFGYADQVQHLIDWCRHGPPMAKVVEVKVENIPYREASRFRVVY